MAADMWPRFVFNHVLNRARWGPQDQLQKVPHGLRNLPLWCSDDRSAVGPRDGHELQLFDLQTVGRAVGLL